MYLIFDIVIVLAAFFVLTFSYMVVLKLSREIVSDLLDQLKVLNQAYSVANYSLLNVLLFLFKLPFFISHIGDALLASIVAIRKDEGVTRVLFRPLLFRKGGFNVPVLIFGQIIFFFI